MRARGYRHSDVSSAVAEAASGQDHWVRTTQRALPVRAVLVYLHLAWFVFTVHTLISIRFT